MAKWMVVPVAALSLMTLGVVHEVMPANAANAEKSAPAGEDDDDDTPITVASSGGGAGAPSGGAATGAGGMALESSDSATPELAAGAAGLGLLGLSIAARRRRAMSA